MAAKSCESTTKRNCQQIHLESARVKRETCLQRAHNSLSEKRNIMEQSRACEALSVPNRNGFNQGVFIPPLEPASLLYPSTCKLPLLLVFSQLPRFPFSSPSLNFYTSPLSILLYPSTSTLPPPPPPRFPSPAYSSPLVKHALSVCPVFFLPQPAL